MNLGKINKIIFIISFCLFICLGSIYIKNYIDSIKLKKELDNIFNTNINHNFDKYLTSEKNKEYEEEIKLKYIKNLEIKKNKYDYKEFNKENEDKKEIEKEISYKKLKEINEDYMAWLNIENTNISGPIVMPKNRDNEKYLHTDFNGNKSYAGTLFIDAFSNKEINQDNLIIYGHNMKNRTMFGNLRKFKNKDFFNEHKYIEIYSEKEKKVYEVIGIREVNSDINTLTYKLEDINNEEYIEKLKSEAINFREIKDINNQILTLSTCVGDSSKRLVLNAILIK